MKITTKTFRSSGGRREEGRGRRRPDPEGGRSRAQIQRRTRRGSKEQLRSAKNPPTSSEPTVVEHSSGG
jgi:hypothetical protein